MDQGTSVASTNFLSLLRSDQWNRSGAGSTPALPAGVFLNRVDDTIIFRPLSNAQMSKILDLRLNELRKSFQPQSIFAIGGLANCQPFHLVVCQHGLLRPLRIHVRHGLPSLELFGPLLGCSLQGKDAFILSHLQIRIAIEMRKRSNKINL